MFFFYFNLLPVGYIMNSSELILLIVQFHHYVFLSPNKLVDHEGRELVKVQGFGVHALWYSGIVG